MSDSTDFAAGPPSEPTPKPGLTLLAFCPKCGGKVSTMAKECLHCGYDFPMLRSKDITFSFYADLVLIIAAGITALGCVGACVWVIVALVNGQPGMSLLASVWAVVLLALTIVFLRVQRFEPR